MLVVRQEAVQLTAPDVVDIDARGTDVRARRRGPRALVTVEVIGAAAGHPARLTAELGPGQAVQAGAEIGLRLPADELSVVAGEPARPMRPADVAQSVEDGQR